MTLPIDPSTDVVPSDGDDSEITIIEIDSDKDD